MNKTILTYGLISGMISAALMLVTATYMRNDMNFKYGELIGYTGILLSMLFVFLGTRSYRDNFTGGTLTFGQTFRVAILITVISCTFYVVTSLIVYSTMMPDFMDKFAEHHLAQLKASGASEVRIEQEAAKMEQYKAMYQNPFIRAALFFLEPFPIGLLVSLISSLLLRTRKQQAPAA